jgi:hypothetical protein
MPQLLGHFRENMVLHNTVCRDCNNNLGKQLELWLGRHSFEALQRWRFGQKPISDLGKLRGKGVKLRLPLGSPWEGAVVVLRGNSEANELMVDLTPQIGVKRPRDEEFRFFTEEEFSKAADDEIGVEKGSLFKIIGLGDSGLEKVFALLRKRVPSFKKEHSMPALDTSEGEVLVAVTAHISALLVRAIAKIAFNYLAHKAGSFALDPSFNEVRRFIRLGEGSWKRFVSLSNVPVLANDALWYGALRGHIVVLDWPGRAGGIVSKVSPFNEITYVVTLAHRCEALWRPLQYGSYFDWENEEIKPLTTLGGLHAPWQTYKP